MFSEGRYTKHEIIHGKVSSSRVRYDVNEVERSTPHAKGVK